MTQPQDHDVQVSSAAQPKAEDQADDQTEVSDDQVEDDGTGRHGRPSDDSDPGHS